MRKIFILCFVCFSAFAQNTRKFELATDSSYMSHTSMGNAPELVVQEWHSGSPDTVNYSADGKYIFSADYNGLKIWDAFSGVLLRTLTKDDNIHSFLALKISPNESYFVCQNKRGGVEVRDFMNNTLKIIEEHSETSRKYTLEYAFSNDGKRLAISYKDFIDVYDTKTWKKQSSLEAGGFKFDKIKFSPKSSYIIARGRPISEKENTNDCLLVWNLSSNKLVRSSKADWGITSFDISLDEKYIALGFYAKDNSGSILVQNIKNGNDVKQFYADTYNGKASKIDCLKFSPDGKLLYSADYTDEPSVRVWNFRLGQECNYSKTDSVHDFSFSPDKKTFALACYDSIEIRKVSDGELAMSIQKKSDLDHFSYQESTGLLFCYDYLQYNKTIAFDSDFTRVLSQKDFPQNCRNPFAFDGGIYYLGKDSLGTSIMMYDVNQQTEKKIKELGFVSGNEVTASRDGNIVAYERSGNEIEILNIKNKTVKIVKFTNGKGLFVSPKGNFVSSLNNKKRNNCSIEIFDVNSETMQVLPVKSESGCFSPDDKYYVVSCKNEKNKTEFCIYDTSTLSIIKKIGFFNEARFSPDGKKIALVDFDKIEIYSFLQWKKLVDISLKSNCKDFCFSSDGSKIIANNHGGTIFCYSATTGELLSSTIANSGGDWLTYTPEGYFNGSEGGINKFVHLVNGMEVSELGQYAETLFRPDLVAAKIRGEDISKEEGTTSLAELVSTGEAPLVSFVNPPPATNNRDITVNFNVQNMGGGIGSVYLKINGKVIQLADGSRKLELVGGSTSTTQKSSGKTTQFSHLLTLQNGENTLEAYATNSAGKIESLHATATITWQGKTAKPNLYVLAVGVNKYRDRSLWLNYAVPDATSIADQFRSVKGNLYQSINVTSIFDGDVTANGISSAFNSLASKVGADDVFIFYLSGHGTTHTDGDYYFIPVDFRFRNAQSVPETAISKHFITENLSKIKAQKSLVMLDTCNSGAFISTGARGMAEKTAIDRLSRATGQATIAASSDTQSAMEGYEGHGIFTYVILEGLSGKADTNKDGYVSLSELSAYAEEKVPDYSYAKWGYEQYPQVDLRKQSNFPLVGK